MEVNYELSTGWECNWKCDYCLVDTHSRPKKLFCEVYDEAVTFERNSSVTLSGGEPGLLKQIEIERLFYLF